jgi:hypothetical protein
MIRSRAALVAAACLAAAVGGTVASAQADSTGATGTTGTTVVTAPAATITVNGSATASLASDASPATVNATYLSALTAALTDAHTKATALSSAVSDTLGTVENITEQSDDSGLCSGPTVFNAAGTAKGAPSVAPRTSKPSKKHGHHGSKTKGLKARMADATGTCTIEADITVTYAMAPA